MIAEMLGLDPDLDAHEDFLAQVQPPSFVKHSSQVSGYCGAQS